MSKPMSVKKFIKKKNKILKKLTGFTLVPKDQIIDIDPVQLSLYDDMEACPYCVEFIMQSKKPAGSEGRCEGCPLYEAENGCLNSEDSSYEKVNSAIQHEYDFHSLIDIPKIQKLVKKYNKSHGFATKGDEDGND